MSNSFPVTILTYNIASNIYQIVKGDTGDLAYTISIDNSTQYYVKYKITFNYSTIAQKVLEAISDSPTLKALLNSLIEDSGLSLTGLDGKCVTSLGSCDYIYSKTPIDGDWRIDNIVINGTTYTAPSDTYLAGGATPIQNWLNGLGLGTFSVEVDAGPGYYFLVQTQSNPNTVEYFTIIVVGSPFIANFISDCQDLKDILQSIINYLCELTALQVALGSQLTLWQFDYNGVPQSTGYPSNVKQDAFNRG